MRENALTETEENIEEEYATTLCGAFPGHGECPSSAITPSLSPFTCDDELTACGQDQECSSCMLWGISSSDYSNEYHECASVMDAGGSLCDTFGHGLCCVASLSGENGCLTNSALLAYWDCSMAEFARAHGCSVDDAPCLHGMYVVRSTPIFSVAGVMPCHEETTISERSLSLRHPLHPVV